jgi:hypothetical protein
MSEKIFLTYTNATAVPYQGSVLGHHAAWEIFKKVLAPSGKSPA